MPRTPQTPEPQSPASRLTIVHRRINELKPADYNPRQLSEDQFRQIKESIEVFGIVDPIIINTFPGRENVIVGGHQRCKVAQSLGITEIPCVEVPLDEEREKELNVRLNKATGEWDFDALANNFSVEDLLAWGFTEDELGTDEGGGTQTAGDDDVPDGGVGTPLTVLGDLYEVKTPNSTVRLICGDTTNLDTVNKVMNGEKAHITVTDAPYNVSYGHNLEADNPQGYRVREIANDSMTSEQFRQFIRDTFTSIAHAMKEGAHIYAFMSCKEWGTMMQVLAECGFWWSSTIIWAKSHAVLSRGDYHKRQEPIFYGWKEGAARLCPLEDRTQNDVWDIDRPSASPQHPTTKPVVIYERAIKNSSHPGDNCIDFFTGSGSGAIACIKTGRNFFGIELSPVFVDRVLARIHRFASENSIEYTVTRNGQPFNIQDVGEVPTETRN